jgi:hypothetical protein
VSGASSAKYCPTRAAIMILSAAHASPPPPPSFQLLMLPSPPPPRRSLLYEACTSDYVCELLYDAAFCFFIAIPAVVFLPFVTSCFGCAARFVCFSRMRQVYVQRRRAAG